MSGALVAEAEAEVRRLVGLIERGVFWPPSPTREWAWDFGEWISGSPEESVDPAWIEEAGAAVVKRSYRSPEWDPASGFVRALEQVTLYGLPLVTSRRRDYGRIDPVLSRTLFIRFGLVGAAFPRPPPVVRANAALLDEMRARAEKTRRPELFDEAALERFFDAAVPADVASADAFRAWLRAGGKRAAASVALRRETWLADDGGAADGFPASIVLGGVTLGRGQQARAGDEGEDLIGIGPESRFALGGVQRGDCSGRAGADVDQPTAAAQLGHDRVDQRRQRRAGRGQSRRALKEISSARSHRPDPFLFLFFSRGKHPWPSFFGEGFPHPIISKSELALGISLRIHNLRLLLDAVQIFLPRT
jgi:hypothetical protein